MFWKKKKKVPELTVDMITEISTAVAEEVAKKVAAKIKSELDVKVKHFVENNPEEVAEVQGITPKWHAYEYDWDLSPKYLHEMGFFESQIELLNKYGKEGWEVINITKEKMDHTDKDGKESKVFKYIYHLKRPILWGRMMDD